MYKIFWNRCLNINCLYMYVYKHIPLNKWNVDLLFFILQRRYSLLTEINKQTWHHHIKTYNICKLKHYISIYSYISLTFVDILIWTRKLRIRTFNLLVWRTVVCRNINYVHNTINLLFVTNIHGIANILTNNINYFTLTWLNTIRICWLYLRGIKI